MQTIHLKPFDIALRVLVPESVEDFLTAIQDLEQHDELAADTETVGVESEACFIKALQIDASAAEAKADRVERIYIKRYFNKRTPSAKAFRAFRASVAKELALVLAEKNQLKNQAISSPSGLHFWENKLGCVQVGYRQDGMFTAYLIRPEFINPVALGRLLNSRKLLLFQNAKFDWKMLKQHLGIELSCKNLTDTMISEYLILNGMGKRLSMGQMAKRRLGMELNKDKELRVSHWTGVWSDDMIEYGALDIVIPFLINDQQQKDLDKPRRKLLKFECQLIPQTAKMEMRGLCVDIDATHKLLAEKQADRDKAVAKCVELLDIDPLISIEAQETILNSPKQLKDILVSKLGFEIKDTEAKTLVKLVDKHPEVAAVLEYRKVAKLISTYLLPFIHKSVRQPDGSYRIFGELNQTKTETSRYSSNDPNLQNFPATEEFRNLIIARPGYVLVSADLANIEPRILTHVTRDPLLVKIFREGKDPYIYMASLFLGVIYMLVSKDQRKQMKPLLLAAMYGKTAFGLAKDLEISQIAASQILRDFFNTFLLVKRWVENSLEFARKNGYIETLNGLRRYLPDINSEDRRKRSNAENAALNTQIQGLAAYCMKESIMVVGQMAELPEYKEVELLLTLHDELLAEVPDTEQGRAKGIHVLKTALVDGTSQIIRDVPIKVGSEDTGFEPSVIYKWGEMKAA